MFKIADASSLLEIAFGLNILGLYLIVQIIRRYAEFEENLESLLLEKFNVSKKTASVKTAKYLEAVVNAMFFRIFCTFLYALISCVFCISALLYAAIYPEFAVIYPEFAVGTSYLFLSSFILIARNRWVVWSNEFTSLINISLQPFISPVKLPR